MEFGDEYVFMRTRRFFGGGREGDVRDMPIFFYYPVWLLTSPSTPSTSKGKWLRNEGGYPSMLKGCPVFRAG